VLVFVGLLGFARSGLAGRGRGARVGANLALAGTALLFVGEVASIPIRHQHVDDTGATIVGVIFGLAIVLSALGLITAGTTTLRARRWPGWGAATPLIAGLWTATLLGAEPIGALAAGVAGYGLCLLALGIGLLGQTSAASLRVPALYPEGQRT
jgi:hypothetical protein